MKIPNGAELITFTIGAELPQDGMPPVTIDMGCGAAVMYFVKVMCYTDCMII